MKRKELTAENLDSTLLGILDDNKDLVKLQEEKAKLLPKYCQRCNRSLKDYKECQCKDDIVRAGEYMVWTSVDPDHNGGIGGLSYECFECCEHFRLLPHLPGQGNCHECNKLNKKQKN